MRVYADHVDGYGIDFFRLVCERDAEGLLTKHRQGRYDGFAKWIKVKNPAYTQAKRRHELFERRISAKTTD